MKAPDGPSTLQSAPCAESLKLSMSGGGRIQEVRRSKGEANRAVARSCRTGLLDLGIQDVRRSEPSSNGDRECFHR